MKKINEERKRNSCFQKAALEEMIFVLRAQDKSSARVILHWISKNFDTCPDAKLREAFECAMVMKNYPVQKTAD